MNRRTRVLSLLALVFVVLFAVVPVASAFDGRRGDTVVIGKDEVVNDDLFVSATTVTVDGTVNGDLAAVGQTVTINGKVTGNVFAAGSAVTVNGEVGHDFIAAGAAVTLGSASRVGYNVYAAGNSVESKPGARVGGSLVLAGAQGLVAGQTTNDLLSATGRMRLDGTVGRNAKIVIGSTTSSYSPNYSFGPQTPAMPSVPAGLTFGSDARVAGSLEYISPEAFDVPASVTTQVTHTLPPQDQKLSQELAQRQSTSSYIFDAARRLITLLLVGLLVAWVAPRWIIDPADRLLSRPLPSLVAGLVGIVAAPISWLVALLVVILVAVVFGLLSLGGLTALTLLAGLPALGVAIFAILFVALYLCQAIVGYLGGRLILGQLRPEWNRTIYGPLLIGLAILGILIAVPLIGGWVEFLAILGGLGAIALATLQGRSGTSAPAEAPAEGQV